jgi:hypothetical protein
MNTFKITWTKGTVREVEHEAETVDAFKKSYFGTVDAAEHGVTVELLAIDGQKPPADAKTDASDAKAAPAAPTTKAAAPSAPATAAKDAGKAA